MAYLPMKQRQDEPPQTICYLIIPYNREEHGHIAFAAALKRSSEAPTDEDFCGNVASMIHVVNPSLRKPLQAALLECNLQLQEIRVSSQAEESEIDIGEWPKIMVHLSTILVYFGCCILLLFKSFNDDISYKTFMSNSIRAMREKLGVDPDFDIQIPFSRERASSIKAVFGGSVILKEAILCFLMGSASNSDLIGNLCRYLVNTLSWSDMQVYTFVNDTLVLSESPILSDHRISSEVTAFRRVQMAINSSPFPKFYGFTATKRERDLMNRSRFPILSSIAEELKNIQLSSVTSCLSSQQSELVAELVVKHYAAMKERPSFCW